MTKHKVVHITSSLKTGGAETVLVDLIRNINKNKFENHVIYFHEGPNVKKLTKLGIKTHKINGLVCKYDPIFIIRFFYLIRKLKPDCIHSLLWSANILATLVASILKIPIACAFHLATNSEKTGKNTYFRNTLDKKILPRANKFIAVSDSMVNDLKNNTWFKFHKLKVIKNGIDIDHIKLQSDSKTFITRDNYNLSKDHFVIGTVGRFIPRKNQKMLIESFFLLNEIYKKIHLILIGYGPLEHDLKEKTKKLRIDDKVSFIKSDNAPDFYKLFDCFVLTSNQESFGLVILEAMLFNLPCIITNNSYDHEIITNEVNGYIIKNDDNHSLYLILKKLYEDRNILKQIGVKGKQHLYNNFDIKKMTLSYEKTFSDLIKH